MKRTWIGLAVLALWLWPAPWQAGIDRANADQQSETLDAAVYLLKKSTTVDRDGTHNLLLKALRHLNDPDTRPLFAELAQSDHPGLRVHGILGLAETDPDKQVDLALIATIEDPAVQATVISAAMDDGLLSHDQAKQLLNWDGLADEVRVLVAVRLVEAGKFKDTKMLKRVLNDTEKIGGGALAALLLMQLGDPAGRVYLDEKIDTSSDDQRDPVRAMLLQTAMRHELDRAGPWAMSLAEKPGGDSIDRSLRLMALRTALRFDAPGANELWAKRYAEAKGSAAQQIRLALTALHLSPWLDPELFTPLTDSDDSSLRAIGQTGALIALGSEDVADHVVALLDLGHPMINNWALKFAREHAGETDAQIILLGMVLGYQDSPQRGKDRRLEEAIEATQVLYERDPQAAKALLAPVLTDPSTDKLLTQAVLLGLVRTREPEAVAVIEGIQDQIKDPDAKSLALLLLARSGRTMTDEQLETLSLLARGAGRLEDSLRIQVAWTYLKRAGMHDRSLALSLGQ